MTNKLLTTPASATKIGGATSALAPVFVPRRKSTLWKTFGPLAVFVLLLIVVAIMTPGFIGGGGIGILTVQATSILLLALGQAAVLHVGSIDLSNAAMALFSAIILASLLAPLGALAPFVSIAIVTIIGAINGLLIAFTQVPSFALTLGTLGILQAATLVVSKATTVYVTANADVEEWLFSTTIAGVPAGFVVAVVIAVVLWAVFRFTAFGQGMTALGLNETGAIFSGLPNRWLKVGAFAISGLLAGIAGVTIISQSGAASSFGLGSDLLLPGITAAIVGGTAITGGNTNPINIVFGALTIALAPIAAAVLGVNAQAQSLMYGVVIIVVAALTMTRNPGEIIK